jgi:glycosyltransferase involved in cell wall biosynthesis
MPNTTELPDTRGFVDATDEASSTPPCVDVVIPVFNEATVLEASVTRLHDYLSAHFPFTWRITVVDNASTDGTWFRAARLARDSDRIRALHLDRKGRGLALRRAWSASDAAVVAYMDVDLSTDLDALLPLIAPLVSGHSDVAIGSRLSAGASVARRPKRELISRSYNAILHTVFATSVRDAQCGFKAVRSEVARRLLPAVADDGWFFDTELLLLAERNGLRIHEVPVDWIDDADSRVHVVRTAAADLAGTVRMAWTFVRGGGRVDLGDAARHHVADDFGRGIVSVGLIGAAGMTVALVLFFLLSGGVGTAWATIAAAVAGVTVAGRRLVILRAASRTGWLR